MKSLLIANTDLLNEFNKSFGPNELAKIIYKLYKGSEYNAEFLVTTVSYLFDILFQANNLFAIKNLYSIKNLKQMPKIQQ
mmetsp:Transcript_30779/g.28008  ORF Transcript_30779/g.28008 Transcript_30779/m.28008 type:complete len:80 (+) Transcript_30779:2264-2503(+)